MNPTKQFGQTITTKEQLDQLEKEVRESFLIAQQNILKFCNHENKKDVLLLISEITMNSLRMIEEMRNKIE